MAIIMERAFYAPEIQKSSVMSTLKVRHNTSQENNVRQSGTSVRGRTRSVGRNILLRFNGSVMGEIGWLPMGLGGPVVGPNAVTPSQHRSRA
jgi:hypothetical protein